MKILFTVGKTEKFPGFSEDPLHPKLKRSRVFCNYNYPLFILYHQWSIIKVSTYRSMMTGKWSVKLLVNFPSFPQNNHSNSLIIMPVYIPTAWYIQSHEWMKIEWAFFSLYLYCIISLWKGNRQNSGAKRKSFIINWQRNDYIRYIMDEHLFDFSLYTFLYSWMHLLASDLVHLISVALKYFLLVSYKQTNEIGVIFFNFFKDGLNSHEEFSLDSLNEFQNFFFLYMEQCNLLDINFRLKAQRALRL